MKKLTAESAGQELTKLKVWENDGVLTLKEERYLQALEIALPILEQQELMIDPSFYVVYHPNPKPSVNDDKEYCECGSIHLARKLAAKIGGTIRPVYVGPKMEQPERATNQNGEQ